MSANSFQNPVLSVTASINLQPFLIPREGHAITAPLKRAIREKTLEAWVQLDTLDQRGGGVMSLQTPNGAVFDAAHAFAGCIPGIHEVLRRQGLLAGTWCLDPSETLSTGQAEALDRVSRQYPQLTDDEFVRENLDRWMS